MRANASFSVTEDMTIYHALDLKTSLLNALGSCEELELNLSQVGEMDTAGLQLLIMLKHEAQLAGKRVNITHHSPAVQSVIDFCNLGARFGDPLIIPASKAS